MLVEYFEGTREKERKINLHIDYILDSIYPVACATEHASRVNRYFFQVKKTRVLKIFI